MSKVDKGTDDLLFFADEGGAWQVGVDWRNVLPAWFRVLSATVGPSEYAQRITTVLKHYYKHGRICSPLRATLRRPRNAWLYWNASPPQRYLCCIGAFSFRSIEQSGFGSGLCPSMTSEYDSTIHCCNQVNPLFTKQISPRLADIESHPVFQVSRLSTRCAGREWKSCHPPLSDRTDSQGRFVHTSGICLAASAKESDRGLSSARSRGRRGEPCRPSIPFPMRLSG